MRIPYNWVLVKPYPTDQIILNSGLKLFLATQFSEQSSAPSFGEVLEVPEKLRFSDDPDDYGSMDFETDIEIKVGDKVVFHYLTQENAKGEGRIVDGNFLIRYDLLYVAMRGEEVIPLNGYLIVEPENPFVNTPLFLPPSFKRSAGKKLGKVLHAGTPVRYRHYPDIPKKDYPMYFNGKDWKSMDRVARKGDRIFFSHYDAVPLQQDPTIHGALQKIMLYKMQHKDVLAVVSDGVLIEE